MKEENNPGRSNIVAAIVLFLLTGSAIYVALELGRDEGMENKLKDEKLNAEVLLSEKLLLEKERISIQRELLSSEEKNADLKKELQHIAGTYTEALQEVKTRSDLLSRIRQLNTQQQEMSARAAASGELVKEYKVSLDQSQALIHDLQVALDLSQSRNNLLETELKKAHFVSINDILVESTRKNGKLDVKARKIKTIRASIDIPSVAGNISFKIFNPSGKELTHAEGDLDIKTIGANTAHPTAFYTASDIPSALVYDRVHLRYDSKEILAAGVYKIEIRSTTEPIGTLQVKLR